MTKTASLWLVTLAALLSCCMRGVEDDAAEPGPDGDADSDADGDEGLPTGGPAATCDGSLAPEIPDGYPALGPACRSRFRYEWVNELFDTAGNDDVHGPRGARPLPEGVFLARYDMGIRFDGGLVSLALFLPSLEPGVYRGADGAGASRNMLSPYQSWRRSSGVLIEVAGRSDTAVWGRFVTRMCDPADYCYSLEEGRFSAALDAETSAVDLDHPPQHEIERELMVCEISSDCDAIADCVLPRCEGFSCTGVVIEDACSSDESCDWYEGCVAP